MRIPLLKITIYSVAGKYKDPAITGISTTNQLTYELDRIEGEENGLHDYFLKDSLDFFCPQKSIKADFTHDSTNQDPNHTQTHITVP